MWGNSLHHVKAHRPVFNSRADVAAPLRAGPGVANGYRLPARKQGVFDQRYFDANGIAGDAARGARYDALKRVVRWPGR